MKDLSRNFNHLNKKNYLSSISFYQVYQFHQNMLISPYDEHESLERQMN